MASPRNQPPRNQTPRSQASDRRQKVEELRKAQRASERRRTWLLIGGATVVGLGLVLIAAWGVIRQAADDPANAAWNSLGVPAAQASCDPVATEPAAASNDHRPDGEAIEYDQAPPSSGPHYGSPATFERKFYTPADSPPVEQLVHNLEHGYTVLWYDPAVLAEQEQVLRDLATKTTESDDVREAVAAKFAVAPWDTERGAFPDGKAVALSHWGASEGAVQYCGEISGEAVRDFVQAHPYTDSPEPLGS